MKSRRGTTWQTCSGALLVALGVFCTHYAWRASRAMHLYHDAKYGAGAQSVSSVLRAVEQAHRLYPHNYRFCLWAAQQAYQGAADAEGEARDQLFRAAENWSGVGLGMNRFNGPLQLLKARLLQRSDPAAAAESWARYVKWHFWEPYNHAVLVDLYADAGNFDGAADALDWVKGSEHYEWALGRLQRAWRREMTIPTVP